MPEDERKEVWEEKVKYLKGLLAAAGPTPGVGLMRLGFDTLWTLSRKQGVGSWVTGAAMIERAPQLRRKQACSLAQCLDYWNNRCGAGIVEQEEPGVRKYRIRKEYWNTVAAVLASGRGYGGFSIGPGSGHLGGLKST